MTYGIEVEACRKNRNLIYYWIWESWRLAVGPRTKSLYFDLIDLQNVGAKQAGYNDAGEIWKREMDFDENVDDLMERLMAEVQPFYNLICTFVKTILGEENLPAHHLGWNANWNGLYQRDIAKKIFPYSKWDIDRELLKRHWSTNEITKKIEDFYTSMGLYRMTELFWNQSIIGDKIDGSCHGTAADMFSSKDFRIVACDVKTIYDFYVIVHEMGHIEQFMMAQNQPAEFRAGNSIVQETIGDAIFLSMMTPMHLNRLNLIEDEKLFPSPMNQFELEQLMLMAFMKIPEVPFGYVFERFRYDLLSQKIKPDEANDYYWELTKKYQKITPPSNIDRHNLFDAASKFHLAANVPYARYFFANILQFQVFKALCEKTVYGTLNTTLPMALHKCDIYGSKRAGKLLK
jgi:peptidyl-dipeptidase A